MLSPPFYAAGDFVLLLQEHRPGVRPGVFLVLLGLQWPVPVRRQVMVLQWVQLLPRVATFYARLFRPGRKAKVT